MPLHIVGLSVLDWLLWYGSIVASASVLCCLMRRGLLVPPFRTFAMMIGMALLRDVLMLFFRYDTHAYALAWECSLIPLLVLQCWTASDCLKSIALLYPKIGHFAVRLFWISLGTTIVLCCSGLPFEVRHIAGNEGMLRALFLLQRWIASLIAGSLLLTVVFFLHFPLPAKRLPYNLVVHVLFLIVYFTGYGALFFAENVAPLGAIVALERVQLSLVVVLYALWVICLSSNGSTSEAWPRLDTEVVELVQARNRVALALLRYVADE